MILLAVVTFNFSAYADNLVVGPGKKITLDYTLTVDNKQVETSVGKTPLVYAVGSHNIIPGLEAQLNGMHMNEEKVITVAPKDAYGNVDPKRVREALKTDMPVGLDPKVGSSLIGTDERGMRFQGVITAVKGDKVTIDFNHPLAGKTLTFKVKVLKIENAPVAS